MESEIDVACWVGGAVESEIDRACWVGGAVGSVSWNVTHVCDALPDAHAAEQAGLSGLESPAPLPLIPSQSSQLVVSLPDGDELLPEKPNPLGFNLLDYCFLLQRVGSPGFRARDACAERIRLCSCGWVDCSWISWVCT